MMTSLRENNPIIHQNPLHIKQFSLVKIKINYPSDYLLDFLMM